MALIRRVFWPDTHTPFHDKLAVKIALELIKDFKPQEIVILGDFFDCYSVSQYDKDPLKCFNLLEDELVEGRELLSEIERVSKCKSVVFLEGNHEARIAKYINVYASKLGGTLSVREVLKIPKHYRYFPYGQSGHYRFANFIATHGSIANQHSCASMVKKYGANVIFGHVHQLQEYHVRNIHGDDFAAYSCGWLGDMERAAEYVKNFGNWTQGLGLGYSTSRRTFMQLVPIINHEAVLNGEIYGK